MGMLCFAAFLISLITELLNGIFRMQRTTNFWTFLSLVSQFTNLPRTFVSTLLFPSTILKQQWHFEVDRDFKFCESLLAFGNSEKDDLCTSSNSLHIVSLNHTEQKCRIGNQPIFSLSMWKNGPSLLSIVAVAGEWLKAVHRLPVPFALTHAASQDGS